MNGLELKLDHWYDMVIVGLMVVASILAIGHSLATLVMLIFRKGNKFKVGNVELSGVAAGLHDDNKLILKELQLDMAISFGTTMEVLKALRALLEAAKGECNGNVDEALVSIKKKQKTLEDTLIKKMRP